MKMIKPTSGKFFQSRDDLAYEYFLLAAITTIALILRFYKLGEWSFWIDELYQIRDSVFPNIDDSVMYLIKDMPGQPHFAPISFMLVGMGVNLLGLSEWSARLFPALIGVVSIPILYFPIRKIFSPTIGLSSMFLLAISPWHIHLSQNARYFSALVLFYTLALLVLYLGLEKQNPWYIFLSILLLALAVYERFYSGIFIPVVFCYLILLILLPFETPRWLNWRYFVIALFVPIIMVVLYDLYNWYWHGTLRIVSIISTILSKQFFGNLNRSPQSLLMETVTNIGFPLSWLAIIGSFFLIRAKRSAGLLLTVAVWVPMITFMVVAPFFFVSTHYNIVSLPCWMILGAVGLRELYVRSESQKWILIGVLGAILLAFFKDRVVKDIFYYLEHAANFRLLFAIVIGSSLITVFFLFGWVKKTIPPNLSVYSRTHGIIPPSISSVVGVNQGLLAFGLICVVVLAHSVLADILYYQYQQGYRYSNYKAATAVILEEKSAGDTVVATDPLTTSYYLGEKVEWVGEVDLNTPLDRDRQVWFIDDWIKEVIGEGEFESWSSTYCTLVEDLGWYFKGRILKLDIYRCEAK